MQVTQAQLAQQNLDSLTRSEAFNSILNRAIKQYAPELFSLNGDNAIGQRKAIVRVAIKRFIRGGMQALVKYVSHISEVLTKQLDNEQRAKSFMPISFVDVNGNLATQFAFIINRVIWLSYTELAIDLEPIRAKK